VGVFPPRRGGVVKSIPKEETKKKLPTPRGTSDSMELQRKKEIREWSLLASSKQRFLGKEKSLSKR